MSFNKHLDPEWDRPLLSCGFSETFSNLLLLLSTLSSEKRTRINALIVSPLRPTIPPFGAGGRSCWLRPAKRLVGRCPGYACQGGVHGCSDGWASWTWGLEMERHGCEMIGKTKKKVLETKRQKSSENLNCVVVSQRLQSLKNKIK